MKKFMNSDFNINKIVLAIFVAAGTGDAIHKNRPSHGLAIHKGGEKIYIFSDGKILTVKENDIIAVTFGERTLTVRVLTVKEHVTKADASSMYEVVEG